MEQLMRGFVPGLPPELTARILDRAEGVPLYAVETVRMLLDKGLLVQEGSVYGPVGPIDDLDVPETLHALIAARLDGLSAEERRLVQDAAVLGKTFTRAALAALSGLPERDLEPLMAALVAKEVLSVQADPRSPERGQYGFLQDLVRTVAYDTLAKRDRKDKHLLVADYLEKAWGDEEEEIVEVVAAHLMDAYGAAPDADDAREIRARAAHMLVRAAERAASLAAGEEAETYFRQAAEMSESELERAELMEKAGQMSVLRGHLEEAATAFGESTHLYEEAGQSHPAARVQAALAEVEFRQDHLEAAVERVRRAHEVLSDDEPDRDRATVAAQLGRFLSIAGHEHEAMGFLEEALELAETLELPEVYSHALSSRGVGLLRTGRLDESTVILRRALEIALEHDNGPAASRAYNNLSVAFESLDRFHLELELAEDALALTRRKGDRASEIAWLTGSLMSFLSLGRWDEGVAWAEEARAMSELTAIPWAESGLLDLIPIQVRRGELDAASGLLHELDHLRTSDNAELAASYASTEAELLRAQGRAAEALPLARKAAASSGPLALARQVVKRGLVQALEAAMEMGDTATAEELLDVVRKSRPGLVTPYLRGHGARFAARLAAARGEDESVESGFRAAEEVFREIPMPFDLGVTLVEHAEWLSGHDRIQDAEPLVAEAGMIFDGLRANPWIERTSRLVPHQDDGAMAEVTPAPNPTPVT
jgi:tetratricopeptide (TPR) repeat protein